MAKLPTIDTDPTLAAIDAALEAQQSRARRPYLGASAIGDPCERKLWYSFHWTARPDFDAETLKRFRDGHASEDVQAADLRLVDGIELHTHQPNGQQYGFEALHGHFRGHYDGLIRGLLQAPKTEHVWEHKATGEKSMAKLVKLKADKGEKNALKAWNETYYGQAQVYMHQTETTRHYLTVSSPGCRTTVSCRTDYCKEDAEAYLAKAERIIASDKPPIGVSTDPTYYLCKWCDYSDICYGQKIAEKNCRTCVFSHPGIDGKWFCQDKDVDLAIPKETEFKGCDRHLYRPSLIPAEQVGASEDEHYIAYKTAQGEFKNGAAAEYSYPSEELQHIPTKMLGDYNAELLRAEFGGEFVGGAK